MLMYASTHPWRSAAVGLCGAAGLALAVGLGAAMETGAPALELASDAVVMPSATPLPAEPATTELDVPAADGVRIPLPSSSPPSSDAPAADGDAAVAPPAGLGSESSPTSPTSPTSSASPAEETATEAAEEPAVAESAPGPAETSRPPAVGPPMPTNGDVDCADFERQSFPIDPANDPNNLDADGDGIACEPPPGSGEADDLDCDDFTERSFRIDPNNDPNNLDRDGDGIACEPPPDE